MATTKRLPAPLIGGIQQATIVGDTDEEADEEPLEEETDLFEWFQRSSE